MGNRIAVLLIAFFALCAAPYAHARMASTNYSMDSYAIGKTGSVMSSTNFTLVPSSDAVFATREGGDDSEGGGEDDDGGVTAHGSKRRDVERRPTNTSFIARNVIVPTISSPNSVAFATDASVLTHDAFTVENKISTSSEKESSREEKTKYDEQRANSTLLANIVSGDWDGFVQAFNTFFSERSSRVWVLVCVLFALIFLRMRTAWGRKNLPF